MDADDVNPINDTRLNRVLTLFALKFSRVWGRPRGTVPFLPGNTCVKYGTEVHMSEAHSIKHVADNTSMPVPKVYCVFKRKGLTYIVMSRVKGRPIGLGWKEKHDDSKKKILNQLKGYIQELRSLTPPKAGYVGGLEGCYAYDMRIPAIQGGFKSADSVTEFHRLIRENIDQTPGASDERKAIFERLVALQKNCSNNTHFSHGDLSALNILVNKDEVIGILDWDTSGWYPDYWEYARRKCDCHPFEHVWSNETDRYLDQFNDAVEMENIRIELYGRL